MSDLFEATPWLQGIAESKTERGGWVCVHGRILAGCATCAPAANVAEYRWRQDHPARAVDPPVPVRVEQCGTCRFYLAEECHYGPPAVHWLPEYDKRGNEEGLGPVSRWPDVETEDWCGKWKPERGPVPDLAQVNQRLVDTMKEPQPEEEDR